MSHMPRSRPGVATTDSERYELVALYAARLIIAFLVMVLIDPSQGAGPAARLAAWPAQDGRLVTEDAAA